MSGKIRIITSVPFQVFFLNLSKARLCKKKLKIIVRRRNQFKTCGENLLHRILRV